MDITSYILSKQYTDSVVGGPMGPYTEKLIETTGEIDLDLGNVFIQNVTSDVVYSIINPTENAHSLTLIINQGDVVGDITFNNTIKWQGGEAPNMSFVNKTYILTLVTFDIGVTWLAMFGGEF